MEEKVALINQVFQIEEKLEEGTGVLQYIDLRFAVNQRYKSSKWTIEGGFMKGKAQISIALVCLVMGILLWFSLRQLIPTRLTNAGKGG